MEHRYKVEVIDQMTNELVVATEEFIADYAEARGLMHRLASRIAEEIPLTVPVSVEPIPGHRDGFLVKYEAAGFRCNQEYSLVRVGDPS